MFKRDGLYSNDLRIASKNIHTLTHVPKAKADEVGEDERAES